MASQNRNDNEEGNCNRWTCEACGCVTNSIEGDPTSCSICGSPRQLPDVLRRDESLSSQLLSRSFFVRRGGSGLDLQRNFNQNLDQMENDMMDDEEDDHAVAALALEVAGVADAARIPGARSRNNLFLRSVSENMPLGLDAIPSSSISIPTPNQLLDFATENSALYNPQWSDPQSLGMRHKANKIEVGEEEFVNVATMPIGATEGKSIRTLHHIPLPRDLPDGLRRKTFGFRVAFKRPYREIGKSLGGNYLIGVTTSSFSTFGERNSLQQSSLFWGIDDNGHKYEGGSSIASVRGARRSRHGIEINNRNTARNGNALYGCLETITVVIDMESRTLTFWRDEGVLGTLVRNIPASGELYPVAVPFNSGAAVAITGINGSPTLQLQRYEDHVNKRKIAKKKNRQKEIREQRSFLVCDSRPTKKLETALKTIFALYKDDTRPGEGLSVISASRLWYRSCLKLTHLDRIVSRKVTGDNCLYSEVSVTFKDFLAVICDILREDETIYHDLMENSEHNFEAQSTGKDWKEFMVGNIVELVEGYEMFGDAARGPMVPGDRGQVVEVQQGSNGERYSIRVLFNGRRWWYQPQTLLSEKSSLVATPGVWFIQRILRSHGFDYTSFQPIWGEPVTNSSWLVGDIVIPATTSAVKGASSSVKDSLVGRVVPPSSVSTSQYQMNDRDSGMVCIEFVDPLFGLRVGLTEEASDVRSPSRVHRVSVKQLAHAGISQIVESSEDFMDISEDASNWCEGLKSTMLTNDIMSVSTLDAAAIESVTKACEESFGTLARLFTLGLPSAIVSALELVKTRARNNEEVSNFLPALTAIGKLIVVMAKHFFGGIKDDDNSTELQETIEVANNHIIAPLHVSLSNNGDSFFRHDQSSIDEQHGSSPFEQSHNRKDSAPEARLLRGQSQILNSIRRGGFEVPSSSEDPRRGSLVLNAATKSAILNGLLANNYAWFHKVAETAKRRKSSTANSSLINARDEDGTQLLTLAILLGCSKSIISFLVRNGAIINDDVIKKAAYLGQKSVLDYLLNEYVYVEGALNRTACSKEIIKTIENVQERQKEQEDNLHKNSPEFLSSIVKSFTEFGIEMRCCFAPKAHVYRVIAQVFVGRTLLRAIHNTRLSANLSSGASLSPMNPKAGSIDPESGRVAVFSDNERGHGDEQSNPSYIAAFEGFLFAVPPSRFVDIVLNTEEGTKKSLSAYLRFMEALIWTKDVEDIALGLALLAIFMRRVPVQLQIDTLQRFGITDMLSFHTCEADKQLELLAKSRLSLMTDSRRFSPHHVASREQEAKNLLSIGVVLCPKCHVADLHLTRHSSFRCDLCGKGIGRGYPMHGCRECDWDACEDCIDKSEGGFVKWDHVKKLVQECLLLNSTAQTGANQLSPEEQTSRTSLYTQALSTRIKAFDCGALDELSAQLKVPGVVTMFEFTSYYLPSLHDTLYEDSSKTVSSDSSSKLCAPPKKKQRPQYLPLSKIDRTAFFAKAVELFLLIPIETSLIIEEENKAAATKKRSSDAEEESETVTLPGDDIKSHNERDNEHLTRHTPELLRRLHEILSFCERFPVATSCSFANHDTNDLRSLTKPWEIEVAPLKSSFQVGVEPFVLHVEPLIQISDFTRHLAQVAACNIPSYLTFCQSLADDHSIIAECIWSVDKGNKVYLLAQIISYNADTGAHTLKYASSISYPLKRNERLFLNSELVDTLQFEGPEATLVLNCRKYVVIKRFVNARRDEYKSIVQNVLKAQDIAEEKSTRCYPNKALARGNRVGYSCPGGSNFKTYTIIGCSNLRSDSELDSGFLYDLVSEEGTVLKGISHQDIKHEKTEKYGIFSSARILREGIGLHSGEPANPIMGLRGISSGENEQEKSVKPKVGTLRRTWSALSPRDDLVPVDLGIEDQQNHDDSFLRSTLKCSISGHDIEIFLPFEFVEEPPQITVKVSLNESSPPLDTFPGTATFNALFQRLSMTRSNSEESTNNDRANRIKLYYSISADTNVKASPKFPGFTDDHSIHCMDEESTSILLANQSTPLLPEVTDLDKDSRISRTWANNCEKVAIRSMQLLDCLGRHIHESSAVIETPNKYDMYLIHDIVDAALESRSLTRKLSEQLDQTLSVVSGALPTWCTEVPALVPRLFNYTVRRQLMERTAFGVSRATMRLQEAKVNVAPLRQRMAALRGRAVELVGEAFSGGAEDPTALQLQADELYGMEEALGARVHAAFRAQRWKELSLQCAKAAVRRSHLLADAWAVMESYTCNKMHRQRRLEVRFDGESGFDAASGDEAGVTRGFYADVAEAFLSCENILSTTSGIICPSEPDTSLLSKNLSVPLGPAIHKKLPLWIPDLDASYKVVIPTPRASPQSTPGVYPLPLSPENVEMPSVKRQFRLIGRMFAGAIRDGFMFPLPLSSAFLRLVQNCNDITSGPSRSWQVHAGRQLYRMPRSAMLEQIDASDEYSCEENTPTTGGSKSSSEFHSSLRVKTTTHGFKESLDSYDLPRPGFLGGEVFAVEQHICNALNHVDSMNIREDEAKKRYMQIASDRTFARKAFGKAYDCSFEEYFENKTFVDPFDPTQGAFATPLCSDGHLREVTIFNVREYVLLCKQFILCDGVLEQAKAFQEGVSDFFPAHYLKLFTGPELQRDVFGNDVEKWTEEDVRKLFKLDGAKGATEALVAVAAIGGEGGASLSRRFGSSSPTVGFLIKTLLESNTTQRRQFLNFVTSVPIVTPGKIEVVPIVSPSGDFLPVQDNCLPRANTCARRLYLPKFETYERFSSVLWAVIREESRFKGFFEWRGN